MLVFDDPNERYFMHGIDRGVLYLTGKDPVVWHGLTGVDESGDASKSILYRDGVIFLAEVDPGDYEGVVNAIFFPDEFAEALGIPEIADGFYVDNQKPKRFGLSYRTLIGSGATGDMFGYQIHLVYNAVAMIGTRSRKTMNQASEFTEMTFDLTATPIKLPGLRPSAHYIIDTRHMGSSTLAEIEEILYGVGVTPGRMPTPGELYDLMAFGDSITIISLGNGRYTIRGAHANVHQTQRPGAWEIQNINGVNNGGGSYTLSDTV